MRIKIYIFVIVVLLLNVSHVFCASSITDNVITTGLDNMYLSRSSLPVCLPMLEDIKSNKYTIVQPIVRTDDYNDPLLKFYADKCPNLHLNKIIQFEPKFFDYAMTLPEKEQEKIGTVIYYTKDFRIYHVDLDNDPENGKEFIFYAGGGYLARREKFIDTAEFKVIDFSSCEEKENYSIIMTHDENSRDGILNYNGKHYIYALNNNKQDNVFVLSIAEDTSVVSSSFFDTACIFKLNKP